MKGNPFILNFLLELGLVEGTQVSLSDCNKKVDALPWNVQDGHYVLEDSAIKQ